MRLCALLWSLALTSRAQSVFCTAQGAQGRAVLSLLCPWTTWGGSSCSPLPWSVHLDFFPLSDGRCPCYFVNVIFSLCCWVGWLWTGECYHLPPPAGVCHLFVLILLQHCASKKKKSVYPETVDIWGLLQMLPPYIPNIWIKYLVIIFQHSLQLTPFGLNLRFNQISTSIFFLLEMQWRQNHSV